MLIEPMDCHKGEQALEATVAFPLGREHAPAVLVVHVWSG